MKKLCVSKSCKSDSRYSGKEYMSGVFFIPFPKPKRNNVKCEKWINWLNREDYPISRVNANTYLCSKHFVGGKGPTLEFPDPVHSHEYVSILKQRVNEQNILPKSDGREIAIVNKPTIKPDEVNSSPISMTTTEQTNSQLDLLTSRGNASTLSLPNHVEMEIDDTLQPPPDSLFDLSSIFKEFSPPLEWSIRQVEGGLKICKFKVGSDKVLYCVKLNCDLIPTYKVQGKLLVYSDMSLKFPKKITSIKDLEEVIFLFNSFKICPGNGEKDFIEIFKNRTQNQGFISFVTGGIHSEKCELLMHNGNKTRCFPCAKQRLSLQVTISRKKKKNETSITRFSNLNKFELAKKLRESKNEEYKLKTKIKRLQAKMAKQVDKNGEDVTVEDYDYLLEI